MELTDLTYKINGCAESAQHLRQWIPGSDLPTLPGDAFRKAGLSFEREKEHVIFYEGEDFGTRRADFIVEGQVMVELKALISLEDVHLMPIHLLI